MGKIKGYRLKALMGRYVVTGKVQVCESLFIKNYIKI